MQAGLCCVECGDYDVRCQLSKTSGKVPFVVVPVEILATYQGKRNIVWLTIIPHMYRYHSIDIGGALEGSHQPWQTSLVSANQPRPNVLVK